MSNDDPEEHARDLLSKALSMAAKAETQSKANPSDLAILAPGILEELYYASRFVKEAQDIAKELKSDPIVTRGGRPYNCRAAFAELLFLEGKIGTQMDDPEKVAQGINALVQLQQYDRKHVEGMNLLAEAYFRRGDYDGAKLANEHALEKSNSSDLTAIQFRDRLPARIAAKQQMESAREPPQYEEAREQTFSEFLEEPTSLAFMFGFVCGIILMAAFFVFVLHR